ncbi:ATP-binding protein [Paenibacillus larvae]
MIKINKLEIENVKRVKAVKIEPTTSGLTVVGGKNNQGKTSVLDAIAWGLGGNKYRPSQAQREGSAVPPHLHIVLSNGLVVERKGKNSDLKVIDPNGQKGGQQLLDSFVEELAIDLPKFMNATNKEKASILLRIIGVGDKLHELETREQELYNRRHAIGQIADQKAKYAKE